MLKENGLYSQKLVQPSINEPLHVDIGEVVKIVTLSPTQVSTFRNYLLFLQNLLKYQPRLL